MSKPVKLAVALRYSQGEDDAPVVVGAGRGVYAKNITRLAKEHDVPLHKDPYLAQLLSTVEIGAEIPPELYQAVAQVLAFIWKLDKTYAGEHHGS
jgi:flagellar biosynthesis protein